MRIGTIAGTVLGTSTVTAYVESAAGVREGARTGLASLVTAGCFLLALFCAPLAEVAGHGVQVGDATLRPVVAPALIVVGSFMMSAVTRMDLRDPPAAFAAFLTIVTMPFAFSITDGIALGAISLRVAHAGERPRARGARPPLRLRRALRPALRLARLSAPGLSSPARPRRPVPRRAGRRAGRPPASRSPRGGRPRTWPRGRSARSRGTSRR